MVHPGNLVAALVAGALVWGALLLGYRCGVGDRRGVPLRPQTVVITGALWALITVLVVWQLVVLWV